jgi:hypothetical protein
VILLCPVDCNGPFLKYVCSLSVIMKLATCHLELCTVIITSGCEVQLRHYYICISEFVTDYCDPLITM